VFLICSDGERALLRASFWRKPGPITPVSAALAS
jgi:hypothetical protein